jgi:hypothetical protein
LGKKSIKYFFIIIPLFLSASFVTMILALLKARVTRLGEFGPTGDYLVRTFFLNQRDAAHILGLLLVKSCFNYEKRLGNNLGDFYTNSSGHPAPNQCLIANRLKHLLSCEPASPFKKTVYKICPWEVTYHWAKNWNNLVTLTQSYRR